MITEQDRVGSDLGVAALRDIVLALNTLQQSLATTLNLLTTRGDLLTRGASGNQRLAVGANGALLGSDGTDTLWRSMFTTIESGNMPAAATLTIDDIPAIYSSLILQLTGISCDTATRHPLVQVDTDNGASFDTTAGNYVGESNAGAPAAFSEASLINGVTDQAAAITWTSTIWLTGYQAGPRTLFSSFTTDTNSGFFSNRGVYIGSVAAINALQVLLNGSGSFDAGTYALYGVL